MTGKLLVPLWGLIITGLAFLLANFLIVLGVVAIVGAIAAAVRLFQIALVHVVAMVVSTLSIAAFWCFFPGFVLREDGTVISMSAAFVIEAGIILLCLCRYMHSPLSEE
jgi:hypothetical protein